jgi:hypothetical protein
MHYKGEKMKKPLLILLICLLCFFVGYFAGMKSKPIKRHLNNTYRMGTIPRNPIPRNGMPLNIQNINKMPAATNIPKPAAKNKINIQPKTQTLKNKK